MDTWTWQSPAADVLAALGSGPGGLTSEQAAEPARTPPGSVSAPTARRGPWHLLLRQFMSPIIVILLIATLISIAVDDPVDGVIILTIILASGLLGFVQERRADAVMVDLLRRVQIHADVVRDGAEREVPPQDVVLGDIVVLRAGDIAPADVRLLESTNLLVDESSVTGESAAVEKSADSGPETDATLPADGVFYGTHVVSGEGRAVAVAIGAQTRFGSLVHRLETADVTTEFEREMTRFGFMLTRVMLLLVAAILIVNTVLHRPFVESLLFALALAVGITPQLLPAIVVVSLSMGARRLAQESVLVKRLDAIEDVGGMSMLCSDKTGTLTRGVVGLDRATDVTGGDDARVLRLAAVNAALQSGYPNSMDIAIGKVAGTVHGAAGIDEVPYDFRRRCLSVLADVDDQRLLITKGAVASVLDRCTRARTGRGSVAVDEVRVSVERLFEDLSSNGYRVLAVATKPMPGSRSAGLADETGLILEGFLTFEDPATPNAREAIERLRGLEVDVCLVTGDNIHIATAVAGSVGLPTAGAVTGEEVAAMGDAELLETVRTVRVFAQIDPVEKERIVMALRRGGHTVGFLGDGINDAAALRSADVGISVDTAADVSKHAASLVILDKDLDVVADGIRLGRRTFANTLKYVRVTISANFGNVLSMVVAAVFLPFLPMLPVQILLLNLMSDGPAITIAADRIDPEQEATPRVWSTREVRRFMVVFGLVSSVFDITAFVVLRAGLDADATTFHTAWFVLSLLTELIALLVLRTARPAFRSRPAPLLLVSSVGVAALGLVLPLLPVAAYLGMVPVGVLILSVIVGLSLAYVVANEVTKRLWQLRWPWQ